MKINRGDFLFLVTLLITVPCMLLARYWFPQPLGLGQNLARALLQNSFSYSFAIYLIFVAGARKTEKSVQLPSPKSSRLFGVALGMLALFDLVMTVVYS